MRIKEGTLRRKKEDNAQQGFHISQQKEDPRIVSNTQHCSSINQHSKLQQKETPINLSSHQIDDAIVNALKKGLGFAIAPRHIPVEDIICSIEDAIKSLLDDIKYEIRQDVATSLRHAKPPKRNLKKDELVALRNI